MDAMVTHFAICPVTSEPILISEVPMTTDGRVQAT